MYILLYIYSVVYILLYILCCIYSVVYILLYLFRLWEKVTHHLQSGSVEKATEYKQGLEQRQREEAKHRKEHGLKWETKVCHSFKIEFSTVSSLHLL